MQRERKKIVILDDDPDILEFLQELLKLEGYNVVATARAEYVENLHDGSLPDLILLDILLSGKDGREIVKRLKSQEKTRRIPMILFSAHPNAEMTARAAGADDFLAKPFEVDDILTKIAKHV
jgi:CheY-like chemotaxis protein